MMTMNNESPCAHSPLWKYALPIYIPSVIYSAGRGAVNPVLALAALTVGFSSAGSSAVAGILGAVGVLLYHYDRTTQPDWFHRRISTLRLQQWLWFRNCYGYCADLAPSENKARFLGIWQAIVTVGIACRPFIISGLTVLSSLTVELGATAAIGIFGALWCALLTKPAYEHLGID